MPWIISKPIAAIIGSRTITSLNLSQYLNPQDYAAILSGGATGVDSIAEQWARQNKIEFVLYKPNYKIYGKRAPLVRDEEMVNAADLVIAFWDGQSRGTKYTIDYAKSIGRKVKLFLVEERD